MNNFLSKLFKLEERKIKKLEEDANNVLTYEKDFEKMSEDDLKKQTEKFLNQLEKGKNLEDIKYEAFATVREVARRILKKFPYKVQVMGALALHEGNIAEMKTGEGKTLTSTMVIYLNALSKKGVHVITVNEYLAKRDAEWMGQIYKFLGLSVGVNSKDMSKEDKRAAYNCDITYSTSSEVGFDYLRDNMARKLADKVQRELNFALVDEADSILIDEGRTPLIISGGSKKGFSYYKHADRFAKSLKDNHYEVDIEKQTVVLNDEGVRYAERVFNLDNLYTLENTSLVHHINQALRANYIMKKDKDYTVYKGQIILIDQSTGRLMQGRAYSNGLQQAIEAKENVQIKKETVTIATITYQNYFRLYKKLSGMTGTAKTEEEELKEIYNMEVIVIPTNKPLIREDANDLIFNSKKAKYKAMLEEIKRRHEIGQPILLGTNSVEKSEEVSLLLKNAGIRHDVLNAKNHEREADIIANAGEKKSVTVATNMAGRGTDIKIKQEVKDLGGLAVIGSERNESRRVDNQLRGRAGRQGDPGFSRFYVSLDDDLLQRFANLQKLKIFQKLGDEAIDMPLANKVITSAQVKMEGAAFDMRKEVLKYDEVLRQQREVMYNQRDEVLSSEDIHEVTLKLFKKEAERLIDFSVEYVDKDEEINLKTLEEQIEKRLRVEVKLDEEKLKEKDFEEIKEHVFNLLISMLETKFKGLEKEKKDYIERTIVIQIIDRYWMQHIDSMDKLKSGVRYMAYAQIDPINQYISEGYKLFEQMNQNIAKDVVMYTLNSKLEFFKGSESNE